jgi:two-component system response regulator FixJ
VFGIEAWPFSSAESFLSSVRTLQPKVVLLDLETAPARGADLIETLQQAGNNWPMIALTRSSDIPSAVRAMKLGFVDLLIKPIDEVQLSASISTGLELLGSRVRASEIRRAAEERMTTLSSREISICGGLLAGNPNKVVAYNLGISVRTVEAHRSHIMMKLNVRSIAEVCVLMTQAGLTPSPPPPSSRPAVSRIQPSFSPGFRGGSEARLGFFPESVER